MVELRKASLVKESIMPLYEVVLEQALGGQQIVNRWNFQSGTIPSGQLGAFLLAVGMGACGMGGINPFGTDTALGAIRPLQSSDVVFSQIVVKNLYSVTDFFTYAFPNSTYGQNTGGTSLSPTVAVGLSTDRTRSDVRRGQKRFAGITEADVTSLGELTEGAKTMWQAAGDTMADVVAVPVEGSAVLFTPYVFGREEYVAPSGKPAYRYYATQVEQEAHIARINQWTLKRFTRTQASRQYGRGS